MAKAASSTVLTRTGDGRERTVSILEAQAGGAITPGDKLALNHATTPPTATASSTTSEPGQRYFAVESPLAEGRDAIDIDYASGDVVFYVIPIRGDILQAVAAGVIAVGAEVIDGGGTTPGHMLTSGTIDATTVTNTLIGTALTAGTANNRFDMEVL